MNQSYALDGISLTDLQAMLSAAQTALGALMSGQKVVPVSYAQGDGSKSVTYQQASLPNLRMWIAEIQMAIGRLTGQRVIVRPPIRPYF